MLSDKVLTHINLYNHHTVLLTRKDGSRERGLLSACDLQAGTVCVNGTDISLQELTDMEYLGKLTDYRTHFRNGTIDESYHFPVDEIDSAELRAVLAHKEFECELSCHLIIRENTIGADDVRLVEKRHALHLGRLATQEHLYRLADGRTLRGTLVAEGDALLINGTPVQARDIEDITKMPEINDNIKVTLRDGTVYSGLVSATPDGTVEGFGNGTPWHFTPDQMAVLRYVGILKNTKKSGKARIDGEFLCRIPYYLQNREDAGLLFNGCQVSYVVGITGEGAIAKDVELLLDTSAQEEHYGLILSTPPADGGYGYIGTKFVAKAAGRPARGNVSFRRGQVQFEYEHFRLSVVKYTLYPVKTDDGLSPVSKMEIVNALDISSCGIVEVDENTGKVTVTPLYQATPSFYVGKDVEITKADGSICYGLLSRYEEEGVVLYDGERDAELPLSFEEITDIAIVGVVTQYYNNGTGRIGDTFFFHINEMASQAEAHHIRHGCQVAFSLRNASKGNFIGCTNIRVIHEEERRVYVTDYDEVRKEYTVIDADQYEQGNVTAEAGYSLRIPFRAPVRNLHEAHCAVTLLMRRKGGKKICVSTRDMVYVPVKREQETVYEGFLELYFSSADKQYGFIYPPECMAQPRPLPKEKGVHCHASDFRDATSLNELADRQWLFTVRYTLDSPAKTGGRPAAKDVWITGKLDRKKATALPDAPAQKPKAAVKAPAAPLLTDTVPPLMPGESIYAELEDGAAVFRTYSSENENAYVFAGGASCPRAAIKKLYRFGVVTALDPERGFGTINRLFRFDLACGEPKTINILKNQQANVRLHVIYATENGRVSELLRVSDACRSVMFWDEGAVSRIDDVRVVIDDAVDHYLSVMSSEINAAANDGTLNGQRVYFKRAAHPFRASEADAAELISTAIEVRCQSEIMKIRYDDAKDIYVGCKGTLRFPLRNGSDALSTVVENETPVSVQFQTSADGTKLEAYAEGFEEDSTPVADVAETFAGIHKALLGQLMLLREENADPDPNTATPRLVEKIRKQSEALLKESEFSLGGYAYLLTTLLQHTASDAQGESDTAVITTLYRLLAPYFIADHHELRRKLRNLKAATRETLLNLVSNPCVSPEELVSCLLALDSRSAAIALGCIQENQALTEALTARAGKIYDIPPRAHLKETVRLLRETFEEKNKTFFRQIKAALDGDSILYRLREILQNMQGQFLKATDKSDRDIFGRLLQICGNVCDRADTAAFAGQEALLQNAYSDITKLEADILRTPCRETVRLLLCADDERVDLNDNAIVAVKNELLALLKRLYADERTIPHIECCANETNLNAGVTQIWLVVQNGTVEQHLRAAESLVLHLESYTDGIAVEKEIRVPQSRLTCGEQIAVRVDLDVIEEAQGVVEIGWSATFEYACGFENSYVKKTEATQEEVTQIIQLQFGDDAAQAKRYDAENPYEAPAVGEQLTDDKMFFGRTEETAAIREHILRKVNGEDDFAPGSAVIIYGPKKSGKSSLVNQIKNDIKKNPALASKAIMISFASILDVSTAELIHSFKRNFYAHILNSFRSALRREHPDVLELLAENDIRIPRLLSPEANETWPALFDEFFHSFQDVDNGRHKVLLFMDEFTALCTTVRDALRLNPQNTALASIPNFIKTFSEYGFIQVVMGHITMMEVLDSLGVINHTSEFAKTVPIAELDEAAAIELIKRPMQEQFGFDVYQTPLGHRAVERLLELSGRNPLYLMRLCDRMFRYYTNPEECPGSQLTVSDVNKMAKAYIDELSDSDFDILLREDGDEISGAVELDTYKYLKCVALLSQASYDRRTAAAKDVADMMQIEYKYQAKDIDRVRSILESRQVISFTGDRVKINIGLYTAFILQRNRG